MKFFYCLCAAALLGTFASSAKAFRIQVLDPSGTIDGLPDWEIDPPLSTIDLVAFSTSNCTPHFPVVPSGTACSIVFNNTGSKIENLELVFQAPLLGGASLGCDPTVYAADNPGVTVTEFGGSSCNYDSSDDTYTLEFYGGTGIGPGGVFEFVTDAPADDFPADLTAVPNVPEPASIWMLSSAAALLGLLLFGRRRLANGSLL
jgi:hypothetical protein